jgi:hypothetical protein
MSAPARNLPARHGSRRLVYPSVDIPTSRPAKASVRHVVPLVRATGPARDRDAGRRDLSPVVLGAPGAGLG